MHANLQQLLSIRDGAPVDAECRAHVAECRHCQRELEHLECVTRNLRTLPDEEAPASAWTEIRARLRHDTGTSHPASGGWREALTAPFRGGLGVRQALLEGMLASGIAVLAVVCLRLWTADLQEAQRQLSAGMPLDSAQFAATPASYAGLDEFLSTRWLQERHLELVDADLELNLDKQAHVDELKSRIGMLDYYCLNGKNLTPGERYSIALERSRLMDELLDAYGAPAALRAKFEVPR
ncbi:MAG: hypothetical protein AAF184_23210 [Pseudomonadota bacterium]